MNVLRTLSALFLILLNFSTLDLKLSYANVNRAERLSAAANVINEIMEIPDTAIPKKILEKSHAIMVIPAMVKAGFGFGARFGQGVVSSRDPNTGKWGPPAFITTGGGSFGFQIGVQKIELILVIMREKGIKGLVRDKFTIGGDASVAAGPVGRHAEIGTDILLNAEIYAYSRTKGVFAGVSLEGTIIVPDNKANRYLYKKSVSQEDILINGVIKKIPKEAQSFVEALNKHAGKQQKKL